mmetsp:Transcript_121915/g.215761  ORF Transcript_121915/g.215761 Transcript_121915/m.215761 type:complete len:103 (-) Transcript_121915:127-435(-)
MLQLSKPALSKAAYYKLWGMTANWAQRKNYGWYQVWYRLAPWSFAVGGSACWYTFGWWSDNWKKTATLGIYEPPLTHWDTNMTSWRSEFVKYHAQYPGIPYK